MTDQEAFEKAKQLYGEGVSLEHSITIRKEFPNGRHKYWIFQYDTRINLIGNGNGKTWEEAFEYFKKD